MKRITVDQIMSFGPCQPYTRKRVTALWGGRRSLTPSEIAALDIPRADRVWALVRVITRRARVAWACDCAERAMPLWLAQRPEDRRPQDAIRTTRMWLRGDASHAEVRASAAYAYAAYATTTAHAADAAAYAAYAANAAYANAAASAAYATYAAAYADAATRRSGEEAWQMARLIEYAEGKVTP